jgi:hypothetical protein
MQHKSLGVLQLRELTVFFSKKWASWVSRAVLLLGIVALTGCASVYVDGATKEVAVSQYKKPVQLHPVQMLFEFQTKGIANAQATAFFKAHVMKQVKASGLFAEVSEAPVEGGALLSISLNNVPLTDDVFAKGFVTGLTFGLAGSQVSDGYVCTARYSESVAATPVVKQARHALHTTMGATSAPGNAVKAASMEEGVLTMGRQIISNVLNDLSQDPTFK